MKNRMFYKSCRGLFAVLLSLIVVISSVSVPSFAADTGLDFQDTAADSSDDCTDNAEDQDISSDNAGEENSGTDEYDESNEENNSGGEVISDDDPEADPAEDEQQYDINDISVYESTSDISWYLGHEEDASYTISSENGLRGLAELVNGTAKDAGEQAIAAVSFEDKTISLSADIDMTGAEWTPIGNATAKCFKGTFDGAGHTVSNYQLADASYQGLFGYTNDAVIKNLIVNTNVTTKANSGLLIGKMTGGSLENITAKGSITASATTDVSYMGGIVGNAEASAVIFKDCTSEAAISSPGSYIGGIAGSIKGTIENCTNNGDINSSVTAEGASLRNSYVGGIAGTLKIAEVSDSTNTGRIGGGYNVGGIAGSTYSGVSSSIVRCLNSGTVCANMSGTTSTNSAGGICGYIYNKQDIIENCVNTGEISANVRSVGGIVGCLGSNYNAAPKVSNSYNAGNITNKHTTGYTGGIAGYTYRSDAEIKNCYNRGTVTGESQNTGGVIGYPYSAAIDSQYISDNYYLTGTAAYGNGRSQDSEEGMITAFSSGDYTQLISSLGESYQADLAPNINEGYPILRWQNPDAKFVAAIVLDLDDDVNDGGTTSVIVKSGSTEQPLGSSEENTYKFELPNGLYTYEITKQGYCGSNEAAVVSGSFEIDKASKIINIPLKAQKYDWTITVSTPDADLVLTDSEGNTVESSGKENREDVKATGTVYSYELYNGTYHYKASKFGYVESSSGYEAMAVEGDITVSYAGGAQTVYLSQTADTGKLSFNISAADGAETEPVVSITAKDGDYAERIVYTGSAPQNMVFPAGSYTYTIKSSGYKKIEGEFELTTDNFTAPLVITKVLEVSTEWNGEEVDTDWYTSDSEADEFDIYTPEELAGLAKVVNDGTDNFKGKTVNLKSDINLGEGNWTPIGGYSASSTRYFAGTFNGNGCSITINDGVFAANETGFGLFGYIKGTSVSDRAAVKNLILYGNVKAESAAATYMGALSGYATYTDFSNISNRMSITVRVNTTQMGFIDLGGLVGWSVHNNFVSCSNQGNINGIMNSSAGRAICYVGGIAGMMTQANSASTFSVTDCYNNGNISAEGGTTEGIGGICGSKVSDNYASMKNCYNSGNVSSGQPIAGIGGFKGTDTGNNYYLDTTLGSDMTSLMGESKTADELKALTGILGAGYKAGSVYPVLAWEAAPYSISVAKAPNKTEYNDFEDFDDTGLELTIYYSEADKDAGNGSKVVSGWQILDGEHLSAGQNKVTISYMGVVCELPITVNQVIHEITSDDLGFSVDAPRAGQTPQAEIELSGAQREKIRSANVEWYENGVKMQEGDSFKAGAYYRCNVSLNAVYEDGNVWYNFANNAKPSIEGAYEILYRTLTNSARTMTFTLTWRLSDTLTDSASHSYYKGDERNPADYAQYLDDTLTISSNGTDKTYTVYELEQLALSKGIEKTYSYQGLNSRTNYVMTGIPVYELLKDACPNIVNASDESVITVEGTDYTLKQLRSSGYSFDQPGNKLDGGLPYILAYGADGEPYTSDKGPLYMAAPAANAGEDNTGYFTANVSQITVNFVTAETYQVTFSAEDSSKNEISDARIEVKDSYGNIVYSGGPGTVTLNKGEKYTYEVTADGYGVKTGEISGAATIKAELLKVWTGEYDEPAQDENGAYLIGTAEELMWFNYQATAVSNARSAEMMSADVKLTADIDLSGVGKKWIPMGAAVESNVIYFYVVDPELPKYFGGGAYKGTFDGCGHVIRNLNVDWENYYELEIGWDGSVMAYGYRLDYMGGLFGMARGAVIRNLGIEGSVSVLDRPVSSWADAYHIGGIAGYMSNDCTISNCYTNIALDYHIDHGSSTVGGYPNAGYPDKCDLYMGGIAGSLATAGGSGNIIENCFSLGAIQGEGVRTIRAGGIVGATRNNINTIAKCYSSSVIDATPSSFGETETFPTYVGGIIGDVNSVPLSENSTKINYCFALNPSLNIKMDSRYAHVNRVIGNEEFSSNGGEANYNFGFGDMEINGAVFTMPEDEQSYRNASGRTIAAERALDSRVYTNVKWNEDSEDWIFVSGQYPRLSWEKQEIIKNNDPEDSGNTGGDTGGGDSGNTGGDSGSGDSGNTGGDTGSGDSGNTGGNGDSGGSSGSGSGGSGGSGGGSSGSKTPEDSGNNANNGTQDQVNTSVKADTEVNNDTAYAKVDVNLIDDIVKNADKQETGVISIDASADQPVSSSTVSVEQKAKENIENAGLALELKTSNGTVNIPNAALKEIKSDLTVNIEAKNDSSVSIKISDGGSDIKFSTPVKVSLPKDGMVAAPGDVLYIVNDDGTEEIVPYSIVESSKISCLVNSSVNIIVKDNSKNFNDVGDNSWYADSVKFVSSHEIFNGVGNGQFAPQSTMNRAMFVQMLMNVEKGDAGAENGFGDVNNAAWYAKAVTWASELGIINGYADGRFGPENSVTREQMAVMLFNYVTKMGYSVQGNASLARFNDSDSVSGWAKEALEWAAGAGIINGNADGSLNPKGNATRAEVATIMHNLTKVMLEAN